MSVEFQFYLISPFIVWFMYKQNGKNLWLIPLVLCVVSTILNFVILYWKCPLFVSNSEVNTSSCFIDPTDPDNGKDTCIGCSYIYMKNLYIQTYTRMSPYGFGILAAFCHVRAKTESRET